MVSRASVGVLVLALVVLSNAASFFRELAMEANHQPSSDDEEYPEVPDMWFTQYLDHFNITDNREWKQRYHVIKDFYKKGGPVFILLGGEWEIYGLSLYYYYAVTDYAKKFNALVFQLEHRFYGLSHPTRDVSTKNLFFLSADQALADAAYFIKGMYVKHDLPKDTKCIVFGGSYAANLAAWMRDKYSHLVYGAVADSGPVRAKVNFFEYLNVVKDTLERCNPKCVPAVQETHKKVKKLLKTTEGQQEIYKKFKLCDPIDVKNKDDIYSLYVSLADTFAGLVQYNGSYSTTVDQACTIMLNTSIPDIVDRYAEVSTLVLADKEEECLDFKYDKFVEEMKNISWEAKRVKKSMRQWVYQTCTEYGYYQTSVSKDQLFYEDIPLYLSLQQCQDIYGDVFDKDLIYKGKNRTNIMYGGLEGKGTRVVYIYSEGDPWHALGNTETVLEESPVIYVKGASHCAVNRAFDDSFSEDIKNAWTKVQDIVGGWCQQK